MTWLFLLAGFMAIFGVIGYLRGTRAALVVLVLALLGLMVIGPFSPTVVRYINAFGKGFRFLFSGGLNALSGAGGGDSALQALQNSPPLVQPGDTGIVLGLLFVVIVLFGLLISGLPWFAGKRSVWGLILGLIAGYFLGAVVVRALTPEVAAFLPLPLALAPAPSAQPAPAVPTVSGIGFGARLAAALALLGSSSLVPFIIAVAIVLFVLAATRLGNRSAKG